MIINNLNVSDIIIGDKKVEKAYIGNTLIYERMPDWVRESMEFWYDVKKLGATNESLSANPQLKDFSGNNRPLQLYNFAFSRMSGVGGYGTDFNDWIIGKQYVEKISSNKLKFIDTSDGDTYACRITGYTDFPEIKIKVTNITGWFIFRRYVNDSAAYVKINTNGVHTIPASTGNTKEHDYSFLTYNLTESYELELLPEYPNALVTDGVDDYGAVLNMDYGVKTLFFVCNPLPKIISEPYTMLFSLADTNNQNFSLLRNGSVSYYFKAQEADIYINNILNDKQNGVKDDILSQKKHIITVTCNSIMFTYAPFFFADKNNLYNLRSAFYSAIGFNKVLTQEEIDWVIAHMIDRTDIDMDLVVNNTSILLEDNNYLLTEDGDRLLLG